MIKPTAQNVRAQSVKSTNPRTDVVLETKGDEVHLAFDGQRRYRIRGLDRNHSSQQLKVNILAARDELVHLDTLDLFKARSRNSFIKATASELFTDNEIIKRDISCGLAGEETNKLVCYLACVSRRQWDSFVLRSNLTPFYCRPCVQYKQEKNDGQQSLAIKR